MKLVDLTSAYDTKALVPSFRGHQQLKSRHPFVPAALELLKDFSKSNISVACWAETKWNTEWQSNTSRLRTFIPDVSPKPLGCIYSDHPESGLIASALALVYSVLQCTDEVWLPQQLVSVPRRNKLLTT